MSKLTTDLCENTVKLKTKGRIEGEKAAFLGRNIIDRKNQELGDKMDQGNDDEKNTNIVDKRVEANLVKHRAK